MNTQLWRRVKRYIVSGRETSKVDLKLTLDISSNLSKAEFAKDVTAIANTPGGDGFIIIGIKDTKDRQSADPNDYVPGFQGPNGADAFHIQMINTLTQFCNRVPTIEYEEITHPENNRSIGVITIKRSRKRGHSLIRSSGSIEKDQTWIRRGTASYIANIEDIEEMLKETEALPAAVVINLSGHSLSDEQRQQIERERYIEELIELPVHFGPVDLQSQIEEVVDNIGLLLNEWQNELVIMALPGFSPAAAALLAYIHGLRGGFPEVLWVHSHPDGTSRYVVGSIVRLQKLRDEARIVRVSQEEEREI